MTPDTEALGRRAVACKSWRWKPGMLAHHPNWRAGRVSHVGLTAVRVACRYSSPLGGTAWAVPLLPITGLLPDLSDPATLGGLLALVREAWGDPLAHVAPVAGGWRVWLEKELSVFFDGATEASALVAALEAAR